MESSLDKTQLILFAASVVEETENFKRMTPFKKHMVLMMRIIWKGGAM
jgi:hypothetical protein